MSKNLEISVLLDFYGDLLTEKQRRAVEYYYNDDLSLGEIADNIKISRQGVRDSIKRAEAILINMEGTLGLAKRFQKMQNGLDTIKAEIKKIDNKNMKIYRSDDINKSVKIILQTVDELCE